MGANFTSWLKILDVPLYILPGIICLALYPGLKNPDEAYMTMVTNLFPVGMVGLVLAVLTAALISTVGSALNALSTVFTMDIYVKKFRPLASQKEIIRTGHVVTMAGALISVIITIAIDSIKGLNLLMYSNRYWDLSHRLWRLFSCSASSGNELPRWLPTWH